MPLRKVIFVNNEIYHVLNRGLDSRLIFTDKNDFRRGRLTLNFYQYQTPIRLSHFLSLDKTKREELSAQRRHKHKKLVEIIAYCFMPNHIHLLLTQIVDQGISKLMSKFANSYTRYFNTRHKRTGHLFEGMFKAVHIETDEQLIHVSRYIHINPAVSYIVKKENLSNYPWSSLKEYLEGKNFICNQKPVLEHFSNSEIYYRFLLDQIDYGRTLEKIKHLTLEG